MIERGVEMSPEFGAWALGFFLGFSLCWFYFELMLEEPDIGDDDEDL